MLDVVKTQSPKKLAISLKSQCSNHFKHMRMFPFHLAILLWSVSASSLMCDAMLTKKWLTRSTIKLKGIVRPNYYDLTLKLCRDKVYKLLRSI